MKLEPHLFHLPMFYTIKWMIISGDNMRPIFVMMMLKEIKSNKCLFLLHNVCELEDIIAYGIVVFFY